MKPKAPAGTYWHKVSPIEHRLLTEDDPPLCLAVLLRVGRVRWRACISRPAPLVLLPRFESPVAAAYALHKLQGADDEVRAGTVHPAVDSAWQSDHDGGSSRLAGGVTITVRPTCGRLACRLGGDLVGPECRSLKDACAWIDYVLPPPPPIALQAALCASRQAARDAIRRGGGDKARIAKAFGQAAAQPLDALKAMGLDDTGETQLIRALFAGQTIALKMPGYGAAFA